jgi:hypothetical protein
LAESKSRLGGIEQALHELEYVERIVESLRLKMALPKSRITSSHSDTNGYAHACA